MPPSQPRERDYAFAGSFYAFSIWIGLGVADLYVLAKRYIKKEYAALSAAIICFISVPLLMLGQEWNDHDRSSRYTTRDFAANYLNTCAPNAILFTYGDNETYPLWYDQEVEGIRTDIRVINLSLFDASWCIDQCRLKVNKSDPLPITWKPSQYVDGTRDYLGSKDMGLKGYTELSDVLEFIGSNNPASKNDEGENYLPTRKFKLNINSQEVIKSNTVDKSQQSRIVPSMEWTFNHSSISKGQLIILDILAHNNWKRPIYFCATMGSDSFMGLDAYLQQEGITYRLVPIKKDSTIKQGEYEINQQLMYHHMMDMYQWGNLSGNIHIDDQTNSFASSFKDLFIQLASNLYEDHKIDSCKKVLDRCIKVIPVLPPLGAQISDDDFSDLHIAALYYGCSEPNKANAILNRQLFHVKNELDFAWSQGPLRSRVLFSDVIREGKGMLEEMQRLSKSKNQALLTSTISSELVNENQRFPAF